jgi:hypothetical protein
MFAVVHYFDLDSITGGSVFFSDLQVNSFDLINTVERCYHPDYCIRYETFDEQIYFDLFTVDF